jgi:hypothetical protein
MDENKKTIEITIISFREQYKFPANETQDVGELKNKLSRYLPAPLENIVLKLNDRLLDNSEMLHALFEPMDPKDRNIHIEVLGPPADLNYEEIPYSESLCIRPGFSLDIICPNTDCNKRQYNLQRFGHFDINEMRTHGFQCCRCKYYCLRAIPIKACFTACKIVIKAIKKDATLEDTVIIPANVVRSYESIMHPNWGCWNVLVTPIDY